MNDNSLRQTIIGIGNTSILNHVLHGETGFFLFVDQLSGYLRPFLIRQNYSAILLACLIVFLQPVVRPTGAEWKILQGDFHSVLISETIDQWLKQ